MKKSPCFIALLILLTNSVLGQTEYDEAENDRFYDRLADITLSKISDFPTNTQLSIAIVRNGETGYYGVLKSQDSVQYIENQNAVFEIGSLTKVFTATVLASLVVDRQINLTEPINPYYPFHLHNNVQLTFESLANHTSGLPRLPGNLVLSDINNPYKGYGKSQLEDYLKNTVEIENEDTKTYAYSNIGSGLLGYTLGVSQGSDVQLLMEDRIFDKYNMIRSYTNVQNINDDQVFVKGQDGNGETTANWDFNILFAAGGVLSTSADLAKFATAQFDPKNVELALTRKPTFKVNDNMEIGLGWHVLKSQNAKELIWHNGGTGGYSSSMIVNTTDETAVIILSNVSAFHPQGANIDQLCFELILELDKN